VTEQLVEIIDLARQTLADVRSVASGYRELSLDKEIRSAESLLTAAGVDVRMDMRYNELPARTQTMLAVTLRESVTNVFRHSRAKHCEIVLRQATAAVTLDIVNDGVDDGVNDHESDNTSGGPWANEIRTLSDRVATIGGQLKASFEPDGRLRLRVNLPV
jgi:signal transduction histidine kinase